MANTVENHPVCPETGAPMYRDTRPMTIVYKGETATFDMCPSPLELRHPT